MKDKSPLQVDIRGPRMDLQTSVSQLAKAPLLTNLRVGRQTFHPAPPHTVAIVAEEILKILYPIRRLDKGQVLVVSINGNSQVTAKASVLPQFLKHLRGILVCLLYALTYMYELGICFSVRTHIRIYYF